MRIIGIDPGLKATGYGVVDFDLPKIKLVEVGAITPKSKDLLQYRIQSVYNSLNGIIDEYKPDVLILEKLYAHYKHPATAAIMGHLRGVVCLLCAQKDLKLIEESVKRIRSAVAGNGNATKVQTQKIVAHVLGLDARKLTLDASDALALALGYVHIYGRRL